jgi:hypothetical protein
MSQVSVAQRAAGQALQPTKSSFLVDLVACHAFGLLKALQGNVFAPQAGSGVSDKAIAGHQRFSV